MLIREGKRSAASSDNRLEIAFAYRTRSNYDDRVETLVETPKRNRQTKKPESALRFSGFLTKCFVEELLPFADKSREEKFVIQIFKQLFFKWILL